MRRKHPVLARTAGTVPSAAARAFAKRRTIQDAGISEAPARGAIVLFEGRNLKVSGFMWRRGEVKALGFFCQDQHGAVFFACYGCSEDSEHARGRGRVH